MVSPADWGYSRGNTRIQQTSSHQITQSLEALFAAETEIRGREAVAQKI